MAGKRHKKALALVNRNKVYPLTEAIALLQSLPKSKFDETVEIAINLNVDSKKSDQNVRGVVQLPHGTGKTYRVAVFARGPKAVEAADAGADIVGAEDLADRIQKGDIAFDRCIATPDMMGVVGRVGKILGPRGLMPNPKLGTVTLDVVSAINAVRGGQVEYRTEKSGIVHSGVGRLSFAAQSIAENIRTFVDAVIKARPTTVKGTYLQKISLTSTMGPGIRISVEG